MSIDWRYERSQLLMHVARFQMHEWLRKQTEDEVRIAITHLEAGHDEGLEKLRATAARLQGADREPFIALIQKVSGERSTDAALGEKTRKAGSTIDLAVVCALRDPEFARMEELFELDEVIEKDTRGERDAHTYHIGRFVRKDDERTSLRVVLAHQNEIGMVDAAILCSKIVFRWRPRVLAMVGVCGGCPDADLELGDLVIPREVFTWRTGKLAERAFEPEPLTERLDQALLNRVKKEWEHIVPQVIREWPGPRARVPRVEFAPMACADVVVDRAGLFSNEIANLRRSAIAVDMESYSVFRAAALCGSRDITPIVMKGVMDFTQRKGDEQKALAAFVSARFLYHFALSNLDLFVRERSGEIGNHSGFALT